MATETAPAFLFYVQDFLTDARSAAMSLEARGAYVTLLAHEWIEGGLPADPVALAELLHVTPASWARLWPPLAGCFVQRGDRLVNRRLEAERAAQRDRERRRQEAAAERKAQARAAAAARWRRGLGAVLLAIPWG